MLIPGGFLVGSDFASGYHCISMHEEHKKYVAFALHISELPAAAVEWLKKNFPESYLEHKQCFVFRYAALPFGLSSSCKTFNDLISALMGFWRRCSVDGTPTRVSSYIDDLMSVTAAFDAVSISPCDRIVVITCYRRCLTPRLPPPGHESCDPHGLRIRSLGPVAEDIQMLLLPPACHESPWNHCGPKGVSLQCHVV